MSFQVLFLILTPIGTGFSSDRLIERVMLIACYLLDNTKTASREQNGAG